MVGMRHMHCRSILIFVYSHHLHPETLEFDCNLLSELTRAAQQSLLAVLRECCPYLCHSTCWFYCPLSAVSLQDIPIGINPAVPEERPSPADIFCPVKVYVNDLYPFFLFAELGENLALRSCCK